MDLVETTSNFRKIVWRDLGLFAARANQKLRDINIYRVAEYTIASQRTLGMQSLQGNQIAIEGLGKFENHDQDVERADWARKLQLTYASKNDCIGLAAMVSHCAEREINNPVILRQLKQISNAVVGPRNSPQEARAYIRRAALKLHPDKCKDLEGWRNPHIAYSKYMPADHKYEQAKWGAEGLFALHRALDKLYANPFYAAAMYGPAACKGNHITSKTAAAEYSLLSALLLIIAPTMATLAATAGTGAAAWWLLSRLKKQPKKPREVACRELVIYKKQTVGFQTPTA